MHLSSNPAIWYAVRASGVLAYVLLTCTVLVGVGLAGKVRLARWPRFTVDALHRHLGTLFWTFLGVHVLTTAVDSYVKLSFADLVVPFASSYRSFGLGLGIVATELLVALAIANRLKDKLSYRFWRRTHYLNFAVWGGSTLHGVFTGTDSLVLLYAAAITSVTAAVGLRLASGGKAKEKRPGRPDEQAAARARDERPKAEPRPAPASGEDRRLVAATEAREARRRDRAARRAAGAEHRGHLESVVP